MILTFFLVPLNIVLIALMLFLVFAFRKERGDEKEIKLQLYTIKKTYEEKTKEYEQQTNEAKTKMEEALSQAKAAEESSQKANAECEIKINKMNEDVQKKMTELQNLEDTMKQQAEDKIKEFEKEQREEVEKNMVSIVMSVTKKVLEKTLSYEEHKEIIKKSIDEMKFEE